jgi:hypothetical protein
MKSSPRHAACLAARPQAYAPQEGQVFLLRSEGCLLYCKHVPWWIVLQGQAQHAAHCHTVVVMQMPDAGPVTQQTGYLEEAVIQIP